MLWRCWQLLKSGVGKKKSGFFSKYLSSLNKTRELKTIIVFTYLGGPISKPFPPV
jgi:hypothetical protein